MEKLKPIRRKTIAEDVLFAAARRWRVRAQSIAFGHYLSKMQKHSLKELKPQFPHSRRKMVNFGQKCLLFFATAQGTMSHIGNR
jgi:hypothetical protein